jgi:hypothetical protein
MANTYYCHDCSIKRWGTRHSHSTTNFTGSTYTLGKFMKHTVPPPLSGNSVVSVFNNGDYPTYSGYVVNAMASGSTEVDSQGRTNVIWYAGKDVGVLYSGSAFTASTDTIKVVLTHDAVKVHPFSVQSGPLMAQTCADCGRSIIV